MRRIFISAEVDSIAKQYATNLFVNRSRRFVRPDDGLKALADEIRNSKTINVLSKRNYLRYVSKLRALLPTLLSLPPSQFENYKNTYFYQLTDAELKDKRWRGRKKGKSFSECVVSALRYDAVRSEIIPYYAKLGIKTCVYCNTQYALTVESQDGTMRGCYELDHFKPKDTYPFLAISFFNLQPCCGTCNRSKSNRAGLFNLYTDDINEMQSPFIFRLSHKSVIKYMLRQRTEDLEIEFDSADNKLKQNHLELFHLDRLYKSFGDVVEEIVWKSKVYNEPFIDQLVDRFCRLFPYRKQDINRFLYGFYEKESDINKRPLTKLQQDIAKQMLRK